MKLSDAAGSPSKKGRFVGGRLGYANGPLDVAAAYGQSTAADAVVAGIAGRNKINTFNLGASYDFGVAKLFGEYSRVNDKLDSAVPLPGGWPDWRHDADRRWNDSRFIFARQVQERSGIECSSSFFA